MDDTNPHNNQIQLSRRKNSKNKINEVMISNRSDENLVRARLYVASQRGW